MVGFGVDPVGLGLCVTLPLPARLLFALPGLPDFALPGLPDFALPGLPDFALLSFLLDVVVPPLLAEVLEVGVCGLEDPRDFEADFSEAALIEPGVSV